MRAATLLAGSGALLLAGLVLAYAGSQGVLEALSTAEDSVRPGGTLSVEAELDAPGAGAGVYAVHTPGGGEVELRLTVSSPGGWDELVRADVREEVHEGRFSAGEAGMYTLTVENRGSAERGIIAAVGAVPTGSAAAVGGAGIWLVIAGMLGMLVAGAYAVKRARSS